MFTAEGEPQPPVRHRGCGTDVHDHSRGTLAGDHAAVMVNAREPARNEWIVTLRELHRAWTTAYGATV